MPKKDVVNKNGMVDCYKVMPRKFLLKSHNPNYKEHKLNLPFRMLIIGGSGAGKTQTLMNLIRIMNGTFNNIHIITKNKSEPLYEYLESKVDNGLTITEGINSAPNLDDFDKKEQSLIVMDDLVLEKKQKQLEQYFIRARKLNCSLVYLSQSYFAVPKMMRMNLNYLIIKRLNTLQFVPHDEGIFFRSIQRHISRFVSTFYSRQQTRFFAGRFRQRTQRPISV